MSQRLHHDEIVGGELPAAAFLGQVQVAEHLLPQPPPANDQARSRPAPLRVREPHRPPPRCAAASPAAPARRRPLPPRPAVRAADPGSALLLALIADGGLAIDAADEIQAGVVVAHGGAVVRPDVAQLLHTTDSGGER